MNKKVFTSIIILFPLFSVYSSGISKVSIGDVLIILLGLYGIACYIKNDVDFNLIIEKKLLALLLYILFNFLVISFFDDQKLTISLFSTIRYILFITIVGLFEKTFFDYSYGIKILGKVSVLISFYVILQWSCNYLFGYRLPNVIPGIPLMSNTDIHNLSNDVYLDRKYLLFRPTGVFFEPSHCVQFLSIYLAYKINSFKTHIDFFIILIIQIAIILTGSSTGFLLILFLNIIFLYNYFKKCKSSILKNYFLVGIIIISIFSFLPIILKNEFINSSLSRLVNESGESGSAVEGRLGNVELLFSSFGKSTINFLFGNGIGSETYYLPGIFLIINNLGILGIFFIFFIWIKTFLKNDFISNIWLVIYVFLGFGTAITFSHTTLVFYSFIYCKKFSKET